MALKVEKGTFTVPGATGNQTVSLVDTGFGTVSAVLLWGTYETAEADTGADGIFCIGLGTYRGAAAQQHVVAYFSDDASAASDTARCTRSDGILRGFSGPTPTLDFAAALSSLGDAQFVVNWTDLPATASLKFHYLALGGADITDAMVVSFNPAVGTAPFTQDVTVATGFGKPDLLIAIANDSATGLDDDVAGSSIITFGVGKSDTSQGCSSFMEADGQGTMTLAAIQSANFLQLAQTTFLRVDAALAARADWPTDGFRLTHNANIASPNTGRVGVLALRGTFTSVIGSGVAPITGTLPVTQDLAVGQTPRGAIFFHDVLPVTAGLDNTHADLGTFGLGAMDGTREGWSGVGQDDAAANAETHRHHSESKAVKMFTPGAAGTLQSEADGLFSGTNVRLSWNDIDTVEREYRYLLLGDAPAGGAPAGSDNALLLVGAGR